MKIFILTTELDYRNGWGRYSLDIIGALLENQNKVVIAVGSDSVNEANIDVLKALPPYLEHIKIYPLAFLYAWRLRKYAKDCDVIHCLVEPYSFVAYLLSKLTGKKYFITTHGTYGVLPYHMSSFKKYFHKKSFESAEKIICVSNYTKNLLSEFGLKNLFVINNGINFKNFYHRPAASFKERKDIILSVGALKHRKGQHVSITAFAQVSDKFKNLKYYIVGSQDDPKYFDYLKKLVSDLNIENKVEFLSCVSDEELRNLYEQSKIFVLTSLSDKAHFEGFGLVYLEANACGVPVVGSKDSGAEDAILDGKTGFLVYQNDSNSIAHAMGNILENKELWQELSKNSVIWAKEHDWSIVVKKYTK
ncbi:hypothetical protein MNBD_BACTEROID04-1589, partial [hydrothermal vent metagenome]